MEENFTQQVPKVDLTKADLRTYLKESIERGLPGLALSPEWVESLVDGVWLIVKRRH